MLGGLKPPLFLDGCQIIVGAASPTPPRGERRRKVTGGMNPSYP